MLGLQKDFRHNENRIPALFTLQDLFRHHDVATLVAAAKAGSTDSVALASR